MKKRVLRCCCAAVFLLLCVAVVLFLQRFANSESPANYLEWSGMWLVSSDGEAEPFSADSIPAAGGGGYYRFEAELPADTANGEWLVFEIANAEIAVYLDGQEIYRSSSQPPEGTANLGQALLPLPGGGTLVMELRPLGRMQGFFPPLARLTSDPMDQAGSIAYANYYSLPAGVMAAFFLLLCALFLLGLYNGMAAWRLLLLIFASAGLAVGPMTEGYGAYFLPETLWRILSDQWLQNLAALAVLAYLLSSREREFWRWLGRVTLWSAAALLACYLVSLATGGYLAIYLNAEVSALFSDGIYRGLLFWLTRWLVAACALLSAFELARRLSRAQAEARALAVKDRVMAENYRSLLEKHHDTAVMRHEWKNQLSALRLLAEGGDSAALEARLDELAGMLDRLDPQQYTEHRAINAILQNAAARAAEQGVEFRCSALVPAGLHIDEGDLCTLLINMLDNAVEAAARVPAPRRREVNCHIKYHQGHLAVSCVNSCNGPPHVDEAGRLLTEKPGPGEHGLGLVQMRAVAEKYHSRLNIRYDDETFTAETALQVP